MVGVDTLQTTATTTTTTMIGQILNKPSLLGSSVEGMFALSLKCNKAFTACHRSLDVTSATWQNLVLLGQYIPDLGNLITEINKQNPKNFFNSDLVSVTGLLEFLCITYKLLSNTI